MVCLCIIHNYAAIILPCCDRIQVYSCHNIIENLWDTTHIKNIIIKLETTRNTFAFYLSVYRSLFDFKEFSQVARIFLRIITKYGTNVFFKFVLI